MAMACLVNHNGLPTWQNKEQPHTHIIFKEHAMYRLHGFFTQNSMKPIYVLEEMGVDFEFSFVDLMKGENRTDSFRNMNPFGKVPVLEHDGEFLFESGAICRYVAGAEKSPLYPADKLQRARVDQWMTFFTCHPGRWLNEIFFEKIIKPKAGLGETDAARCEEAAKFAHQQFKMLDSWFENTDWLANDAPSIAEPFALAYVEQTHAIGYPLDGYPRVKNWFARLEARDSTARARALVQPHLQAVMSQ
jgi:glutathione S-transferase